MKQEKKAIEYDSWIKMKEEQRRKERENKEAEKRYLEKHFVVHTEEECMSAYSRFRN